MPFLGKQPTAGFASIVKDDLTGNGTTGPYTLSKQVANANDIAVFVGNVRQEPTDAYTVSGNQLTMTGTVSSSQNFYVLHIAGTVESSVVPAAGTSVPGAFDVAGALTTSGDFTASNSSGHRSLTVKGNQLSNYQGGSILLANEAMGTNYGGTYLYHHKAGGGATTTNAAFNISQRTATGSYVSNIWNVDYDNTVQTFYLPNGALSGSAVMQMESNGAIKKPYQPSFFAQWNAGGDGTVNANNIFPCATALYNVGSHYNTSTYTFTAPVSGIYFFWGQTWSKTNGGQARMSFRKNGTSTRLAQHGFHSAPQDTAQTMLVVASLSANDYVAMYADDSNHTVHAGGVPHTYWGGYLLG